MPVRPFSAYQAIAAAGKRDRMVTGKAMGLTTGQAARYCLVSPDTIVKWIKAENLPAQRTIGGQFRIFIDDLRRFMVHNDMSTALLDGELNCRPYCWECHPGGHKEAGTPDAPCSECLVYRTKALNCYELRAVSPGETWRRTDCRNCPYYRKQVKQRSNE